jgi:hypothetical protein
MAMSPPVVVVRLEPRKSGTPSMMDFLERLAWDVWKEFSNKETGIARSFGDREHFIFINSL